MVIRGKRKCTLTICVHFLEGPLIRDFTAFVSFPFSRPWPAISAVFLERLLYLFNDFFNAFPTVLTTKKTLIVIKTIVKTRDPGDEIVNEATNSETLNSETFFSQASCKVASFPLVLDLKI